MRRLMTISCLTIHLLALSLLGGAQASSAARAASPGQEPTPVIDPMPMPEPIFLPLVPKAYDPSAPGAIASRYEGFVASLSRTGLHACWPATHALLDKPEGAPGAKVLSVLRSAQPEINLDLYVGDYVDVTGSLDLAPAECLILTSWRLDVDTIVSIDIPPTP